MTDRSISAEVTQHGVRLALAEEDAANIATDQASEVHDEITPGILIAQGLELEAQQYVVQFTTNLLFLTLSADYVSRPISRTWMPRLLLFS